ncbi:hypothetical protein AA106556_0306 [Neokomagataea tanensis NBRC 106556]|uniref:Uncharacterized protein n=2 Tax=Neokomagataea TaxID=1223423 RepID=A0ABQ0QGK3_9PROT|nr:hypothetical protein AA106556_0306 [Neokomagataea tanensis NBRC 106556]
MAVLALMARANPALLDDQNAQKCWAYIFFRHEWNDTHEDEFRLHGLLNTARASLANTASNMPQGHISITLSTTFGEYNFNTQSFPVELNGTHLTLRPTCSTYNTSLPNSISLNFSQTPLTLQAPISAEDAAQFIKSRTHYGYVNRDVVTTFTFTINPQDLTTLNNNQDPTLDAPLDDVKFYRDDQKTALLSEVNHSAIAAILQKQVEEKASEAAHAAAAERAEKLERLTNSLQYASKSQKLAAWVTQSNGFSLPALDTMRNVRANALRNQQPVPAILLVHTDDSGTQHVSTAWPGHLNLTLPKGHEALKNDTWYIVHGTVSVSSKDTFPPAEMTVTNLHTCTSSTCEDAANVQALCEYLQNNHVSSQ